MNVCEDANYHCSKGLSLPWYEYFDVSSTWIRSQHSPLDWQGGEGAKVGVTLPFLLLFFISIMSEPNRAISWALNRFGRPVPNWRLCSFLSVQLHFPIELYPPWSVGHRLCHRRWEHPADYPPQQTSLSSTDRWLQGRLVSTSLWCFLPFASWGVSAMQRLLGALPFPCQSAVSALLEADGFSTVSGGFSHVPFCLLVQATSCWGQVGSKHLLSSCEEVPTFLFI